MEEVSTPEVQESAEAPMSLDAVLESSIGSSLDAIKEPEEAPVETPLLLPTRADTGC